MNGCFSVHLKTSLIRTPNGCCPLDAPLQAYGVACPSRGIGRRNEGAAHRALARCSPGSQTGRASAGLRKTTWRV